MLTYYIYIYIYIVSMCICIYIYIYIYNIVYNIIPVRMSWEGKSGSKRGEESDIREFLVAIKSAIRSFWC